LAPPPSTASAAALEYLALLDRALEDRRVTKDEAELLFSTAVRWGLSRDDVVQIHHGYLTSLIGVALQDGVLTDGELSDLREVGELLGYNRDYAGGLVRAALSTARVDQQTRASSTLKGLSVCFTGESICSRNGAPLTRSDAEHLATEAGLRVQASVTKSLDILVLADPDSMSGKAKKARQYGTRLVAERVFWGELGVAID
jgi:DNA polymerase-3 subunit epsilon